MWKACYGLLKGGLQRKSYMAQLHVHADGIDTVPEEILDRKFYKLDMTFQTKSNIFSRDIWTN